MDKFRVRISVDNTLYAQLGARIGAMVDEKQTAYGDSFGKAGDVLRILFPDGVSPDSYDDMLGVVRVIDKLFRIATARDALREDPWEDLAGYGLLGAARRARSGMTGGPGPARSDPGAK
jgi:hypothetical protein